MKLKQVTNEVKKKKKKEPKESSNVHFVEQIWALPVTFTKGKSNINTFENVVNSLPLALKTMLENSNIKSIKVSTDNISIKFIASDDTHNLLEVKSKAIAGIKGKFITIISKRKIIFQSSFITNRTFLNMN